MRRGVSCWLGAGALSQAGAVEEARARRLCCKGRTSLPTGRTLWNQLGCALPSLPDLTCPRRPRPPPCCSYGWGIQVIEGWNSRDKVDANLTVPKL